MSRQSEWKLKTVVSSELTWFVDAVTCWLCSGVWSRSIADDRCWRHQMNRFALFLDSLLSHWCTVNLPDPSFYNPESPLISRERQGASIESVAARSADIRPQQSCYKAQRALTQGASPNFLLDTDHFWYRSQKVQSSEFSRILYQYEHNDQQKALTMFYIQLSGDAQLMLSCCCLLSWCHRICSLSWPGPRLEDSRVSDMMLLFRLKFCRSEDVPRIQ